MQILQLSAGKDKRNKDLPLKQIVDFLQEAGSLCLLQALAEWGQTDHCVKTSSLYSGPLKCIPTSALDSATLKAIETLQATLYC